MILGTQLCQLCVYIYIHIHTHTYIYIYISVCVCVSVNYIILYNPSCRGSKHVMKLGDGLLHASSGHAHPRKRHQRLPNQPDRSLDSLDRGWVNVPMTHHPTIGDMISNRYVKAQKRDIYHYLPTPCWMPAAPSTSPAWVPLGPSLAKSRPRSAWIQAAPILKTGCCKF